MDQPHLPPKNFSPLNIWAMSFGCSVGWGAFVLPGTTFLPIAGPLGSAIALILGALAMLVIAANYHFMAQRYPSAGGAFAYVRATLGDDHAFLCGWFLWLVYAAIIWANASALTLLVRNFFGNFLQFGFHYNLASYDVYLGEILFTAILIVSFGLICIFRNRLAIKINTSFALILIGLSLLCFLLVFSKVPNLADLQPAFAPEESKTLQIFTIMAFAPWAYVGFEAVSNVSQELKFDSKRLFTLMTAGVLTAALVYAVLIGIAAVPLEKGCDWKTYAEAFFNPDIIERPKLVELPVLAAVSEYLGPFGLKILALAVLGGIATGLIGFYFALSRLTCALADAQILPAWFRKRTSDGLPKNVFIFIIAISVLISFAGRSAIVWIVDINTICATIVYSYVSVVTFLKAKSEKQKIYQLTGIIGIILGLVFCLFAFVPNLWSISALATESYFIFALWAIIGFIFFLYLFQKDKEERYGKSTLVWLTMLFIIFGSSLMWMRQDVHSLTFKIVNQVTSFYDKEYNVTPKNSYLTANEDVEYRKQTFLRNQLHYFNDELIKHSLIQIFIIIISIGVVFKIYSLMHIKRQKIELEKLKAEEVSKSKSTFLSNMSHDIRTPMNAIIGFTDLAITKKDPTIVNDYLNKIKLSSNHLLSLINDVLEMSRIESGRIEIQSGEVNLPALLYNLTAIVIGQVEAKHHTFDINTLDIKDEDIISDKLRLNQILLNLIGNSIKYTPEHGHIELNIAELNRSEDLATFEFRVKDNGYGMSKEFAARIFEAFERENDETINKIQGTGLGMSITKHLIDLMNGTIELKTEKNRGSEFIITFPFKISDTKNENVEVTPEIKGLKILVVTKDASISKALASLLKDLEAKVTVAENSEETLLLNEQFAKNGDPFDVYLLDQELPDHTALNLAKELCQSPHTTHSDLILITAYDWLDIKEEALKAGFKAFCHRPIFASSLYPALRTAKGAPETEKTQNQEEAHDFKGKRVLLVDDIDVNREIGLTVLEMYGFEVEEAKDGQEALEMVEKAPAKYYDVVLMDVQMPRMNGMEATKAIRALKDPLKQSVPIVAMTANAFDEDRKNALAWGMNGHIAKPLDMDKLLETLAQIL